MNGLPQILKEIAEAINLDTALKLAEAKGGQRISIPGRIGPDHWLVDVMGMDNAKAFCKYFTNGSRIHLDVPFGPTSTHARREVLIARLIKEGKSANEIAAAVHVTRRTIFAKLARYNSRAAKLPLFDNLNKRG